jgi:YVTN family beta-propeller protein
VTNKIYVANLNSNNVVVIDGATNGTTTVSVGSSPLAIAVNPVTNKIYVANSGSNSVTVIDGANNGATTVGAGTYPCAIALNSITNKIYVLNSESSNVTVIDGTLTTAVRSVPSQPKTSCVIGYSGILAVYSLNGRQIMKLPFAASATKESVLGSVGKIPATGVYKYCFLRDRKVMDEGSFLVR